MSKLGKFFACVLLCACNSSESQAPLKDDVSFTGPFTYSSSRLGDDSHAGGQPSVIDECNFMNADSVSIVRVVGTPTLVGACDAGSKYKQHWSTPVEAETSIAGQSSKDEFSLVLLAEQHDAPEVGDHLLVSISEEDGDFLVRTLVFVHQAEDEVAAVDGHHAVDLPSGLNDLQQEIGSVHRDAAGSCGLRADPEQTMSRAHWISYTHNDSSCEGGQITEDFAPTPPSDADGS